jgi:carbon-monoxide dehydrogenase large subunit
MSEHFTGRREDRRLITGTGRYTADWNEPGQLYAVFLRSDRAHAKILSIDTQAALAMPGVRAVMTSADADIAAMKNPPSNVTWEGRGGTKMNQPDRPVMARGKVLHVGEPVAMVVADSVAAAQDATEALSLIHI